MTKNAVLTINPGAYLDALRTLKRAEDPAERYKPHPLDVEKAAETVEKVNARAAAMLAAVQSRAEPCHCPHDHPRRNGQRPGRRRKAAGHPQKGPRGLPG